MDLKLYAPNQAEKVGIEDEYGITWEVELLPLLPPDAEAGLVKAGVPTWKALSEGTPATTAWSRATAIRCVRALLGATRDGEPVTVNGQPAEKADLTELLSRHVLLARLAALKSLELGQAVLDQRGN